jgi:hypothetical protein
MIKIFLEASGNPPGNLPPFIHTEHEGEFVATACQYLVKTNPNDYRFLRAVAISYLRQGSLANAVDSFDDSVDLDPSTAAATKMDELAHSDCICTGCGSQIRGYWYKCKACDPCGGHNLCQKCFDQDKFELAMKKNGSHFFFSIPSQQWVIRHKYVAPAAQSY